MNLEYDRYFRQTRLHLTILKNDVSMKGYFKSWLPNYFDTVSYENNE